MAAVLLHESFFDLTLQLECTLDETHSGASDVTDHPVETGSDVSDNIVRKPDELKLHAITSSTPVAEGLRDDPTRPRNVYDILRGWKDDGVLLQVTTALRVYASMAITTLAVPVDAQRANVLEATIGLREVRTVDSQLVAQPKPKPTHPSAQAKKDLGRQHAAEASAAVNESTAVALGKFGSILQ